MYLSTNIEDVEATDIEFILNGYTTYLKRYARRYEVYFEECYRSTGSSRKGREYKMEIGWNFPGNNNGQINGISEAGIETFKGALIASLTREICQNSLDAALERSEKPVRIEFDLTKILTEKVPGYADLQEAIDGCYAFWNELHNEKAVKFFNKAKEILASKHIEVLRISDYNTEGLTGSDKPYNTPWQNLVKSNGVSDKGSSAGGSFGIGKAAPFACSGIRTLFYRTLDKDGIKAAQGIARLVSYQKELGEGQSEVTTGIGYYGEVHQNTCVNRIPLLDELNGRQETGTDLFILGFVGGLNWQEEMVVELLEGFMLAFFRGRLEVKVGEVEITKETLPSIMEQYKDKVTSTYDYYRVMTSESRLFSTPFEDMGIINLRVLFEEGLNRKVLISRESGMKLFDKNRISSSIQFSAVLDMEGKEVNGFFRKMESPQHNAWEFDRYEENPAKAKKLRKKLYDWIKQTIVEAGQCTGEDEIDAEGIGDLLPDFFEYQEKVGGRKEETITDTTNDWTVKISNQPSKEINSQDEDYLLDGEDEVSGELGSDGEDNTRDNPSGKPNETNGGQGVPTTGQPGEGDKSITIAKEISTYKIRLFVSDRTKKEYTLMFNPSKTIKEGYIEIQIAGEQSNIQVGVQDVVYYSKNGKEQLQCNGKSIVIHELEKGVSHKLVFTLKEDEIYSLGVKIYASKI